MWLAPLPAGPEPMSVTMARRADRTLVTVPAAFDGWPQPPANVVHVGPIAEEAAHPPWVPPCPADDRRPLAVVTFGTTYMHQEHVVRRVLGALRELDARVLVLTGLELGPSELPAGPSVCVEAYIPHAAGQVEQVARGSASPASAGAGAPGRAPPILTVS